VYVELEATVNPDNVQEVYFCVLDHTSHAVQGSVSGVIGGPLLAPLNAGVHATTKILITGLTPSTSYSWDFGWFISVASGGTAYLELTQATGVPSLYVYSGPALIMVVAC
jgi:hypothetical protein